VLAHALGVLITGLRCVAFADDRLSTGDRLLLVELLAQPLLLMPLSNRRSTAAITAATSLRRRRARRVQTIAFRERRASRAGRGWAAGGSNLPSLFPACSPPD
jgi:hypothetical protein